MALSRGNTGAGSSIDLHLVDTSGDWLTIGNADLMFRGAYQRAGADLKITGTDGQSLTIPGYFATATPPGLKAPNGALLFPETVKALAGPGTPGQYAQVGGQATGAGASAPIGTVEKLSGAAFVTRVNGVRVELKEGDPVFQRDVVETVDGTELNILFVDDTVFTLSDTARMVLDELIYNPGGSGNSLLFNLVQGSFVFVAGKVAPTGDMQIKTPVATMGIRGTTVLVEIRTDSGVVKFDLLADTLQNPGPDDIGKFELRNPETGVVIATIDSLDVSAIFQGLNSPPVLANLTSTQVAAKQEQARSAIEIVSVRVQNDEPSGQDNNENQPAEQDGQAPPGDNEGDAAQGDASPSEGDGPPAEGDAPPGEGAGQDPNAYQGPGIGPGQNVADGSGPFDASGEPPPPLDGGSPPPDSGSGTSESSQGSGSPPPPPPPASSNDSSSGPTNSPPVVTAINAPATDQNQGVITIDLLAGQTDPDGDALSVQSVVINTVPAQAVAFGLAAGVISINASEFNGLDASEAANVTINYDVADGNGGVMANTASFQVTGFEDTPVVTPITAAPATESDGPVLINLLAGQSDPDTNDTLTTVVTTVTSSDARVVNSTVNNAAGTITIDMSQYADLTGSEQRTITIDYSVNDGDSAPVANTATIVVSGVNDAPVATAGGTLGYTENDAATVIDTTITVADVDDTNIESATVQITGNYANGEDVLAFANTANITATFNATNGILTLTGTDTLANYQAALRAVTYQNTSDNPSIAARTVTTIVNDGTANSAGVTSTVNVTAINDTPVAVEDFITTPAPAGISYDVTLNDTDADGDALSVTAATIRTSGGIPASTFGSVTISGGVISYVPATNFAGVVAIDYTVSDSNGGTANGVLRVGVTPGEAPSTSGYTPQDLVEMVIPDGGDNQVTVETEASTVNFTNAQTFANTGAPYEARFADIDGDGYLDAVVSNSSAATFSVYLNNGSGVLGAATDIGTSDNYFRIRTGDFNNDGKLDVVGTSNTGVRIFTQNSPSSFTAGTQATLSVAPNIALGDFNSDGNLDVLVSSSSTNEVLLLQGDGAGNFSNAGSPTQIATTGTQPGGIAVGDFNNDGKLDFAVANTLSDNVSIFLGQGDGTFAAPTLLTVGDAPGEIAVGDIDNNGDLDLVVSNSGSGDVTLLSGDGAGTFTPQSAIATGNSNPDSIKLVDVDFDGDLDAIVGHSGTGKFSLLSFGASNFVAANADLVAGLTTPRFFDVGDLDSPVGRTIIGTTAGETLTGTAGADVLIGLAGVDTINGGNGFDFLIGGPGNDVLNGGGLVANGNDGLVDYRSEEALHDGTQAVTVTFTGAGVGTATDTLGNTDSFTNIYAFHGSSGDDTFDASVLTGDYGLFARGMEGADTFKGSDAYDRIAYDRDRSYGGTSGMQANLSVVILGIGANFVEITDGFGDTDLVEVYSGAGTKIDSFRGTMFADTFTGDDFNNSFQPLGGVDIIDGGLGNDEVDFRAGPANGATNGVTVDLSLGSNQVTDDGFGNTETLTSIERIRGNEFADNITGDANQNRLYGYGDDDTIAGGNAYDTISGGRGDDALSSGSNSWDDNAAFLDYLHEDVWQGGTMGVIANLDLGKVRDPFGTTDTLTGFFEFSGTNLDDVFINTTTTSGSDGLAVRGNDGSDVFAGGNGYDVVFYTYESGTGGINVDLSASGSMLINTFDGTNVTQINFNYDGTITDTFGNTDYVSSIDDIRGTALADTYVGSANDDRFSPLDGADTVDGGAGVDEVSYRWNTNYSASVGVTVDLSANQASNDGFGNVDTLTNFEDVRGSSLDDNITGNALANRLKGEVGNDTLIGGDGNDYFRGGAGNDAISSGSATADGNDGFLDYASEAQYDGGTMGIVANLDIGKVRGTFGDTDTLTGYFAMNGTQFVDVFQFNNGTGGGDGLDVRGLAGNDVFAGGIGFDDIRYDDDAGAGGTSGIVIDFTNSGTLSGVSQFDGTTVTTFSFSYTGTATDGFGDTDYFAGIDRVRGTNQADTFTGSAAEKQIFLPIGGNDVITGGSSDDEVDYRKDAQEGGSAGVSVNLSGTLNSGIAANSAIDGFGDTDTLTLINNIRGTESADTIIGNAFVNRLRGQGGNDILEGGGGDDLLEGGGGTDIFALTVGGGFDEVVDFTAGTDRFDLTDLLDASFNTGNQATYIQTSQDGFGNTVLAVDQDGASGGTNYVNVAQIDGMGAGQIIDIIFDTSSTTTVTS